MTQRDYSEDQQLRQEIVMLEQDISNQKQRISDATKASELATSLIILQESSHYRTIIGEGYLSNYATAQMRQLARTGEGQYKAAIRNIEGVSNLQRFLDDITSAGLRAPDVINDAEAMIQQHQLELDEKTDMLNRLYD